MLLLLVLAADHVITDQSALTGAVMNAVPLAEASKLVTFGILPTEPHTGYGYIDAGNAIGNAFTIASFKEKPDIKTAAKRIANGSYYWNSGMFLMKASRDLGELKAHRPDVTNACARAMANVSSELDFTRVDAGTFQSYHDN